MPGSVASGTHCIYIHIYIYTYIYIYMYICIYVTHIYMSLIFSPLLRHSHSHIRLHKPIPPRPRISVHNFAMVLCISPSSVPWFLTYFPHERGRCYWTASVQDSVITTVNGSPRISRNKAECVSLMHRAYWSGVPWSCMLNALWLHLLIISMVQKVMPKNT